MAAKTGEKKIARRIQRRYGAYTSLAALARVIWIHGEEEARVEHFWQRRGWVRHPSLYPPDPGLTRARKMRNSGDYGREKV